MDLFSELSREIKPFFEGENGCHDFEHTKRVIQNATHIAKIENADLEIVKIASLLHDIGRKEEFQKKGIVCHAEIGAKIAKEMLKNYGVEEQKINKIIHCIETHRFRKNNPPQSLEAKCLFDADKLDSIGAIGVGRAFMWAGEVKAKLHNDKEVIFSDNQEHGPEDTAYREYSIKLKFIKDKMLTSEGKKLAQERHEFMENFFKQLNQEVHGEL